MFTYRTTVNHSGKFKAEYLLTCALGGGLAFAMLVPCSVADAKTPPFEVLYSFNGGADGANSMGPLLSDKTGNFYGTALGGGAGGYGTVFKIASDGTETTLHSFTYADGDEPIGGLIEDKSGNFYGTTYGGGGSNSGTVFELAPDGTETVLHSFTGGSDGASPQAALLMDKAGNLYGTTGTGGDTNDCYPVGCGVVFELTPSGTETALHAFTGGLDGAYPGGSLIMDKKGNLYGTSYGSGYGGAGSDGVVFEIAADGNFTVLHSFTGGSDGANPCANLIKDKAGNFYSTTCGGGASGNGTVFELAPDGTETVLYAFQGGSDGATPNSGLEMDKEGNLYGTTIWGGAGGNGTVFEVTPSGTETLLYSFTGGSDGANPNAALVTYKGRLYGTAPFAGNNTGNGVVFSVKKR